MEWLHVSPSGARMQAPRVTYGGFMPSSSQTGTPPHVLASKLSPPVPQPGAVGRHELVQTLEVAPTTSLRVVVAPAGWGKSALLAHWLRGHARPVAYVALDRGDTDAARCWAHILEAIGRATGVAAGDLQTSLRAPGLDMIAEVVEPLMVHLEAADVTIVLDDLHLASSAEVIESIESLADIRPPGVGLAVASRIDPPLHLPRRRVRQELVEIRLADLRLEVPDATAVLGAAAGHTVDPSIVAALTELTEGWPAGLYLAGLARRASQDDHDVAARFAADDRHLSEYLATEVIAALPDDDRAFLTQTSVLGELDPAICDAMTGTGGSASRLERLAATNLFVIPVEGRAGTYRYHHLFGQWLQAELASAGPEAVADAHELAARALSEAGRPDEAAAQAVASGRAVPAYGALLRAAIGMLDSGHHATLAELAGALPPPPTASRQFDVEILRAWSSIVDGDLDAVERFSQGARDALESGELDPGRYARRGELRLLAAGRAEQARVVRPRIVPRRNPPPPLHRSGLESNDKG